MEYIPHEDSLCYIIFYKFSSKQNKVLRFLLLSEDPSNSKCDLGSLSLFLSINFFFANQNVI